MPDNITQNFSVQGEGNIVAGRDIIINSLSSTDRLERYHLDILRRNVEDYIKGELKESAHEAGLLILDMETLPEVVTFPLDMLRETPDQPPQELPKGKKIKEVFDEAKGFMLILGEKGSGKTTTISQLALDLISQIDQAFTRPIPVIFKLATWTNKQQPFDEWLISELHRYQVPKKDGQKWLIDRRILPLLDGLDEVKVENRKTCVEKINQLAEDYGLTGLVVCSRTKEYTDLNVRLALKSAIYLQPLTTDQIDEYFEKAGDKLDNLRETIRRDKALQTMAQSPLLLNIMSLAYQDTSAESLSDPVLSTDKAREKHLFDTYFARMIERKNRREYDYDDTQTKSHLLWLAQKMRQHGLEDFYIENIQPSWLSNRFWQWSYVIVSRLISVIFFGLFYLGPVVGISIGFIDILRFEWLRKKGRTRIPHKLWWSIANIIFVYLVVGLIDGLVYGLDKGLVMGLTFGLIFGLRGSKQFLENDIQIGDALSWSWRKAIWGGLIVGGVGEIIGLILALTDGVISWNISGLISWMIAIPIWGLTFGLIGAVFSGLTREIVEEKRNPNFGIQLSIRNAIFGGLVLGLAAGLTIGMGATLVLGLIYGLIYGPIFGTTFGFFGAMVYGGFDVIQHYTLRLILVIQGHTPRKYSHFLDYAADRILLEKKGRGYRFLHTSIRDHFADMSES